VAVVDAQATFRTQGYLLLKGVYDAKEVEALCRAADPRPSRP
jgi:hypothetical protein